MNFFLLLLQLVPALIAVTKQVEAIIPGVGRGKDKLDLVLNVVNAAIGATPEVATAVQGRDLNAALTPIVGAVVQTLNVAGVFPKPVQP